MRAGVPYVLRFTSKFFLEILPAALASLIGGFLFAQYHWSSTPAPTPAPAATVIPAERLTAMVEEEHTMLLDFLKREQTGDKPGAAKPAAAAEPAKPRVAVAKEPLPKRRPSPAAAAEDHTASIALPAAAKPTAPPAAGPMLIQPAAATPSPAAPSSVTPSPAPAEVASAPPAEAAPPAKPAEPSNPLVIGDRDRASLADIRPRLTEGESRGVIGSVFSTATAITGKAIDATGSAVSFVVRAPGRVLSRDQPEQTPDATPVSAPAQLAPTTDGAAEPPAQ